MAPTQLRAFAAVVRVGSVKGAAADLGVSAAAISLHIAQLRRELGDKLFAYAGWPSPADVGHLDLLVTRGGGLLGHRTAQFRVMIGAPSPNAGHFG